MQEEIIRRSRILVRRNEEAIRPCSALVNRKMDINSGKRLRTEEKVPILRETESVSEIPVPWSNPRTFSKYNQSCIARQCSVTRRFHRVFSRRKRKRIEVVHHGLIPGGVSLKTGRHAVFFTVVNPMDNHESRHTKIPGNTFRILYFGAI